MKYLILIHGNPTSRKVWEGMSDAQRAEGAAPRPSRSGRLGGAHKEPVTGRSMETPSIDTPSGIVNRTRSISRNPKAR